MGFFRRQEEEAQAAVPKEPASLQARALVAGVVTIDPINMVLSRLLPRMFLCLATSARAALLPDGATVLIPRARPAIPGLNTVDNGQKMTGFKLVWI